MSANPCCAGCWAACSNKVVLLTRLAALTAALAIVAGAFGAHMLADKAAGWAQTGALYALAHAIGALCVATSYRRQAWLMLVGATVFSGTLYAMALGAPRFLGAITPLGGALMIFAWLWIAVGPKRPC